MFLTIKKIYKTINFNKLSLQTAVIGMVLAAVGFISKNQFCYTAAYVVSIFYILFSFTDFVTNSAKGDHQ